MDRLVKFLGTGSKDTEAIRLSEAYTILGNMLDEVLSGSPEKTFALRHLISSKDEAVRALLVEKGVI